MVHLCSNSDSFNRSKTHCTFMSAFAISMEISNTDQSFSLDNTESHQVAPQSVPERRSETLVNHISTATVFPPHTGGNASFDGLSTNAPAYDSSTDQMTSVSSSSTTCIVPTTSSATNSNTPSATSPRDIFSSLLKQWKWETASCAIILAVPTIMVATVFPHGDQPIPRWPFKMSINALLSIYALVFKSAIALIVTSCVGQLQWTWFSSDGRPLSDVVLFDNAGRGPWGLLVLLWAHRFRQPLTILAALIVVSGLAIDPFIQQLIRPFDCSISLDHHVATLPRTNRIDSHFGSGDDELTSTHALRSALVAGLSSSGMETPWKCSTGNCTFPEVYSTLAVCSACEDLSVDVVVNSTIRKAWGNSTTCLSPGNEGFYWGSNDNQLNITFYSEDAPVNLAIMDIWSPLPRARDSFSIRIDMIVGQTTFSKDRRLISTGQEITGCDTTDASNDTWACRGYGAASCTLKPCVRTYSAELDAGHLKERLISQSPDIDWGSSWGPNYYGLLDTQCVSAQQVDFLTSRGYEMHNTTRWIPFYGDVSAGHTMEQLVSDEWPENLESLLRDKCVYIISPELINKVGYGNGMGAFNLNPAASLFVGTVRGLVKDKDESRLEDIYTIFDGPEVIQNIYDYGRVDFERVQSVFRNISDSLTTYLRTHGNASHSEPATGQVQHYATCLGIQWPWITLPAVLAVLTILFLVLVVESTGRLDTPVWKASLLPWILDGASEVENSKLPSDSEGPPEGGITVARMEDESKQILVTLSEGTTPRIEMIQMRDHNLQVADK